MELREAIIHAQQVAEGCQANTDAHYCGYQHDKLVEWLEELEAYRKAEADGSIARLPCPVGSYVYLNTKEDSVPVLCSVQGYYHTIRRNYVRLYPIIQPKDWLGNLSYYYKIAISSFGKTWFKTSDEAMEARSQCKKH